MTFVQNITAVGGNLGLTALVAIIPILYFFGALAIKRMKGYITGLTTLLIALILAVAAFGMPAQLAIMSATHGAVYGIIPSGWIIISSVFLYKLTVKTGQFDIIRNSIISITRSSSSSAISSVLLWSIS